MYQNQNLEVQLTKIPKWTSFWTKKLNFPFGTIRYDNKIEKKKKNKKYKYDVQLRRLPKINNEACFSYVKLNNKIKLFKFVTGSFKIL